MLTDPLATDQEMHGPQGRGHLNSLLARVSLPLVRRCYRKSCIGRMIRVPPCRLLVALCPYSYCNETDQNMPANPVLTLRLLPLLRKLPDPRGTFYGSLTLVMSAGLLHVLFSYG